MSTVSRMSSMSVASRAKPERPASGGLRSIDTYPPGGWAVSGRPLALRAAVAGGLLWAGERGTGAFGRSPGSDVKEPGVQLVSGGGGAATLKFQSLFRYRAWPPQK